MLQRTPEWFAARLGKVTASRIDDVLAELKSKTEATSRRNYRRELVLERFTGISQDSGYLSFAMQQGIAKEEAARNAYAFDRNVDVQECGFIEHPTIAMTGASPDGLINDDAVLELKCPEANAMFEMLIQAPVDRKYVLQAQWQLACSGRKRADVVFYREGCPLEIVSLYRDDEHIAFIENKVREFLAEVDAEYQLLCKIRGPK
jgi:putative phage-type endonuclease